MKIKTRQHSSVVRIFPIFVALEFPRGSLLYENTVTGVIVVRVQERGATIILIITGGSYIQPGWNNILIITGGSYIQPGWNVSGL